ncbi:MAG: hypothetical protein ACE5K9_01720 [Candidatus Methylomirabilales bacterium]
MGGRVICLVELVAWHRVLPKLYWHAGCTAGGFECPWLEAPTQREILGPFLEDVGMTPGTISSRGTPVVL